MQSAFSANSTLTPAGVDETRRRLRKLSGGTVEEQCDVQHKQNAPLNRKTEFMQKMKLALDLSFSEVYELRRRVFGAGQRHVTGTLRASCYKLHVRYLSFTAVISDVDFSVIIGDFRFLFGEPRHVDLFLKYEMVQTEKLHDYVRYKVMENYMEEVGRKQ